MFVVMFGNASFINLILTSQLLDFRTLEGITQITSLADQAAGFRALNH